MYKVLNAFVDYGQAISKACEMKSKIEENLKLTLSDIYDMSINMDDTRGWKLGGSGFIVESAARYKISQDPNLFIVNSFIVPNSIGIFVVGQRGFLHPHYEIMITPKPYDISGTNNPNYQAILGMLEQWDGKTLDGPYGLDRIILEMGKLRLDVEKANEKKTKFKKAEDTSFGDYVNKISKEVSTKIKITRDPISVHDILSGEDKDGDWNPWHESIHMSNQEALKKNGK